MLQVISELIKKRSHTKNALYVCATKANSLTIGKLLDLMNKKICRTSHFDRRSENAIVFTTQIPSYASCLMYYMYTLNIPTAHTHAHTLSRTVIAY